MMNVVAIGLVLSTVAAAGVWSPSPAPPAPPHGDHVVREGRRVVIVEYEREVQLSGEDGGTVKVKETRVLPPDALDGVEGQGVGGVFDGAKGVVSDAAGRVAGAAEEGKERLSDATEGAKGGVLGAVKRCKDRLCGAGRRVEEGAKDAASRVERGAEDAARGAVETAAGKAKEEASDVQHGAAEAAKSAKDRVSEAAKHAKDSAKETVRGAKDRVSDMAERAEEYAEDAAERAADTAAEAEAAVKAKAGEVRKNLTDIARRARNVASDAAAYLLGGPREAARTATAVMHLLGFATAYGTCVWVTFVSSYVLAAALPRQQLGMLQSKLYPVYFRAMAYGVGLALAAHLLGRERSSAAARAQSFNLLAALALVLANMLLLEPKATKVMFERMKVEKEEGRGRDVADIVDPPTVTVSTTATNAARAARAEAAAAAAPAAAARTSTPVDGAAAKAKALGGDAEMSKSRVVRLSRMLKKLNGYSSLCNVLSLMSLTWHLVHLARRLQTGTAC
ncbi:hypothetical protein C2845_PM16G07920 [Panicum miliaceum]|uniref:TMEM205-like domain-containing protein n=1 Tax=Panicum miliaceum TaxID=4540 RepID=A0A3L6PY51_PANMI|nr:hypothetical protein C2845_PM16G07920 [Panicum miliaceum]